MFACMICVIASFATAFRGFHESFDAARSCVVQKIVCILVFSSGGDAVYDDFIADPSCICALSCVYGALVQRSFYFQDASPSSAMSATFFCTTDEFVMI